MSIMVLAIVAGGLAAGLTATSAALGRSKADAIADKVASSEIEVVRRMAYDDIGTVGGNPVGTLVADRNVTRDGATFRVQDKVVYVDNPAPGSLADPHRLQERPGDRDADRGRVEVRHPDDPGRSPRPTRRSPASPRSR